VNFDDDVSLKGYLYFVAGLDNLFNNLWLNGTVEIGCKRG
jgi:hypothetical protein